MSPDKEAEVLISAELAVQGFSVQQIMQMTDIKYARLLTILSAGNKNIKKLLTQHGYEYPLPRSARIHQEFVSSIAEHMSEHATLVGDWHNKPKHFIALHPNGDETREINQQNFADAHGLHRQNISMCLSGKLNHTGGYRFKLL